jgi:hypothetical protein
MAGKEGTIRLKVYLSEEEDKMVKRQARKLGLSVPDYIRHLIQKIGNLVFCNKYHRHLLDATLYTYAVADPEAAGDLTQYRILTFLKGGE